MIKYKILFVVALFMPLGVLAQSLPIQEDVTLNIDSTQNTVGVVSCFDYYTFGSVNADITTSVSSAVSGTPIVFSVTLKNNNPYPVVDGALYVKIFRDRGTVNDGNGPDVVDQFFVKKGVVIPAHGSVPISFAWQIPSYAISGNYKVATFFTTSNKFNLLGLSFTDDVVGNTVAFDVSAENKGILQFNKAGEKVDGNAYYFEAPPPHVSKDAPVVISAIVKNTTSVKQYATVAWEVNKWDAQSRENVVQKSSSEISIPANGTAPVSVTVTDTKYPIYLVVGTLKYKDTKSIIGVRFVREGVDRTRINFPGVLLYPLKKGEQNTLFSCLHSVVSDSVPNGRLDLKLSDMAGNIIHEYSYRGDVTGDMMGVVDKFTPTQNYDRFTLDASLYNRDQYMDGVRIVYDCAKINPDSCMASSTPYVNVVKEGYMTEIIITLIVLILLIMIVTTLLIMRKNPAMFIVVALMVLPVFADAESIMWRNTYENSTYIKYRDGSFNPPIMESHHYRKFFKPAVQIQYHANITRSTGQTVSCGSTVSRGTLLKYKIAPHTYTDIFWFFTGFGWDTPYGDWIDNAELPSPPESICSEKNFLIQGTISGFRMRLYVDLSVAPPTKTITGLNSLSCTREYDGALLCPMNTIGTFNASFNFAQTRGRFYYGQTAESDRDTCIVDTRPMVQAINPSNRSLIFYYSTQAEYNQRKKPGFVGIKIPEGYPDSVSEFTVNVPSQSISCPITVVDAFGAPPNAPTVSGDGTCRVDRDYSISMRAVDPDNDNIRYLIDWDGNGTTDQIVPPNSFTGPVYVDSGKKMSASRTYTTDGDKIIGVRAQDVSGLTSAPATLNFHCDGLVLACIPPGRYCVAPRAPDTKYKSCRRRPPAPVCEEECTVCDVGCNFDTGLCKIAPSPEVNEWRVIPTLVQRGSRVRVFWDVTPGTVESCEVRGTNGDGIAGGVWNALSSIDTGQISGAVNNKTTYTLNCRALPDSLVPDVSRSTIVNIIPGFIEK